MSSLLTQIKQVPVNSGYFVAIATDGALYTAASDLPSSTTTTPGSIGILYKDLGKTVKLKTNTQISGVNAGIYRKVVAVSELNTSAEPVERYIKLDDNSVKFARMG
jgi:hypothetical protein